jgi:hypothetical protein
VKRLFAIAAIVLLTSICTGCSLARAFFSGSTDAERAKTDANQTPPIYSHRPLPPSKATEDERRDWLQNEVLADKQDKIFPSSHY